MFAKSRIFLFKLTLKLFPFAGKTEKNEINIQNETDSKKKKKKKLSNCLSETFHCAEFQSYMNTTPWPETKIEHFDCKTSNESF
jgi:hypothetical protein